MNITRSFTTTIGGSIVDALMSSSILSLFCYTPRHPFYPMQKTSFSITLSNSSYKQRASKGLCVFITRFSIMCQRPEICYGCKTKFIIKSKAICFKLPIYFFIHALFCLFESFYTNWCKSGQPCMESLSFIANLESILLPSKYEMNIWKPIFDIML